MRSHRPSNAQRLRQWNASSIPLRLTRDEGGFANLESVPELAKIDRPWAIGESEIVMAREAAKLACSHARVFGARHLSADDLEDIAQESLVALMEVIATTGTKSFFEEEEFLFLTAKALVRKEKAHLQKHIIPVESREEAMVAAGMRQSTLYWHNIEKKHCTVAAPQEHHLEAVQARVIIEQIPQKYQPMARLMADGCSLKEAAIELGLTLFEAMNRQKTVHEIALRLLHDGLDAAIVRRPIVRTKIDH